MPSFHCMSTSWNHRAQNRPGVSEAWKLFWGRQETLVQISKCDWQTWLMLSVVCNSCWERTAAPCSLHNLCTTWRVPLDHSLLSSSSLDTRSSPERLLFPAALVVQFLFCILQHCNNILTCSENSRTKQSRKTVREIPESQQEKSDYVLQIFMLKCDVGSLKRLSKQGRKRKQSVINGYLE